MATFSSAISSKIVKQNFAVQTKYEAFYTGGKVQCSQDSSQIYCSCSTQINVLNVQTGSVIRKISASDDEEFTTFICGSNDEVLVTASQNGLLRQWNTQTANCDRTWKSLHRGPITCMSFDSESVLLATGGSDSTIKVWDTQQKYCTHNLKGAQGVFSVVEFHPERRRFLMFGAASDGVIRVWDLKMNKLVGNMSGHYSTVTGIQFTEDGYNLLSCGRDKVVIYWDIQSYSAIKTIPTFENLEGIILIPESSSFSSLNMCKNERYFITAGDKGVLRTWKLSTGAIVHAENKIVVENPDQDETRPSLISNIQFISTLNVVVIVTHDHNILFFRLTDLKLIQQLIGYNDEILDVKFCGENDSHLSVATNSCDIRIFNLKTSMCVLLKGHRDIVLGLAVFPSNPRLLASCSKDNTIRLWHCDTTGENPSFCIAICTGHTHSISAITTSQLNTNFIISCSHDTTLKHWKVPENLIHRSPETKIKNLQTSFTQIAHTKNINSVALAPNDKLIATASQDKTAKLWSIEGEFLGTFHGHRKGIWSLQFSPVDQVLVTSSSDSTIKIWNITDFSCLKTFEGHEGSVLKVIFISKGLQLMTSASDGLMKLWTIKTNECIKTFDNHSDKIWALTSDSKEEFVVSGGADSVMILWKDVTQEEKDEIVAKEHDLLQQEQTLANLLQAKRYVRALKLSLNLSMPRKALMIVREILREPEGRIKLEEVVLKLRPDQINELLDFATKWNTNSKNCFEAQHIINCVLRNFSPEDLEKFTEIKKIVEGLIPYTEKHVNRLEKLVQQATFLQYTWQCMKLKDLNIK